jgi:hypothetical protein
MGVDDNNGKEEGRKWGEKVRDVLRRIRGSEEGGEKGTAYTMGATQSRATMLSS